MIIIPGQSGTYRHLRGRVTALLADSGLNCDKAVPAMSAYNLDAGGHLRTAGDRERRVVTGDLTPTAASVKPRRDSSARSVTIKS